MKSIIGRTGNFNSPSKTVGETPILNPAAKYHGYCGIRKENPKQALRIIGGSPISDGEFPWLVLLGFST